MVRLVIVSEAQGSGMQSAGALDPAQSPAGGETAELLAPRLALEILQLGEHRIDVGNVFLIFRCGHCLARLLR
jgi:hypothetical protein